MATIPGTPAVNAGRCPNRLAVVFGERSYTYAELDDAVNQAAHALSAAGLRNGDRMLLMSGNSDRFILALYASLRLGALAVPPIAPDPVQGYRNLSHLAADRLRDPARSGGRGIGRSADPVHLGHHRKARHPSSAAPAAAVTNGPSAVPLSVAVLVPGDRHCRHPAGPVELALASADNHQGRT